MPSSIGEKVTRICICAVVGVTSCLDGGIENIQPEAAATARDQI